MPDPTLLLLVSALVFGSVALLLFTLSTEIARRDRLRRRFARPALAGGAAAGPDETAPGWAIDPSRLGVGPDAQRRLRDELVRAGFFDRGAVATFILVRLGLLVVLPLAGLALFVQAFPGWGIVEKVLVSAILLLIAAIGPGAFLSRRGRALQERYRNAFPDFLDMLVVCINAGLSLEAAVDRAARELGPRDRELRANLDGMAAERRAGKSTPDALRALAERLGFPEARSFAGLLRQTLELGTDVALALTTFSDEMRDKRLSRAEEKAASLPPKLTLPLGLFIFPVVLIVVLAPAVVRVMGALAP